MLDLRFFKTRLSTFAYINISIIFSMSHKAIQALFIGSQVGSKGIAVSEFVSGLRIAFTVSFILSVIGSFIPFLRGKEPKWKV